MRYWKTLPAIEPGMPVYGPRPITGTTRGTILRQPSRNIPRPVYDIQRSGRGSVKQIMEVARRATTRFVRALAWVPRDQWIKSAGVAMSTLRGGGATRLAESYRRLVGQGTAPENAFREAVARELAATALTRMTIAGQTAADPWRVPTAEGLVIVSPKAMGGFETDLTDLRDDHVQKAARAALAEIETASVVRRVAPDVVRDVGVSMSVPAGAARQIGRDGARRGGLGALGDAAELPQRAVDQVLSVAREKADLFLEALAAQGVAADSRLAYAKAAFEALRQGAAERIQRYYDEARAASLVASDALVDAIAREAAATALTLMQVAGQEALRRDATGVSGLFDSIWDTVSDAACSAVDFARDTAGDIICSEVGGAAAIAISSAAAGTAGSVAPGAGTAAGAAGGAAAGAAGRAAICAASSGSASTCGGGGTRRGMVCPSGSGRLESTTILGGMGSSQKRAFLERTGNAFRSDGVSGRSCWKFARPAADIGCTGRTNFGGPGQVACARGLRCPPGYVIERTNIFHPSPKSRLGIQRNFARDGIDSGYQKPYFCAQLTRPLDSSDAAGAQQGPVVLDSRRTSPAQSTPAVSLLLTPQVSTPRVRPTKSGSVGWLLMGGAVLATGAYVFSRRK